MKRHGLEDIPNQIPYKASITGIDGAGKDTVAKLALQQLAHTGVDVVKIGRPAFRFSHGEPEQIFSNVTEVLDRLHGFADGAESRRLIKWVNAANVITQARILERSVELSRPDLIVSSRDPHVDPSVYYDFYSKRSACKRSMASRIITMHRITGVNRDLIIRLKIDPALAVERIDGRIAAEEVVRTESGQPAGMRDKWRHMHENVADLTVLDEGYGVALGVIQMVRPQTTIVEIDTDNSTKEAVAAMTCYAIAGARSGDIAVGERLLLREADIPGGIGGLAA